MKIKANIRATSLSEANSQPLVTCKLKSCGESFLPKRKDQVFHLPECKARYTQEVYRKGLRAVNSRGMHARTLASPQMKKLLVCLSDGLPHTTKELHEATKIENVSTTISELRRCGVNISHAKFVKITETGAKVFQYQLLGGSNETVS